MLMLTLIMSIKYGPEHEPYFVGKIGLHWLLAARYNIMCACKWLAPSHPKQGAHTWEDPWARALQKGLWA